MIAVDLNCDMGESTASQKIGADELIMPLISSANIACGFHGGDPEVIAATIELAKKNQVAIGAHPSFPDRENFGRKEMELDSHTIRNLIIYQVSAMKGMAASMNAVLTHVKPHGALYNMAARRQDYAEAIANAVMTIDPKLVLFGLAGSTMLSAAAEIGLTTCAEVFADRSYQDDGSLTPRTQPGAMIKNVQQAVQQVVGMVKEGRVRSMNGRWIALKADTVCIHGDTPGAAEYAKAIRHGLEESGIIIKSYIK
ncbi:MAG: 5-oxoprolinase subunit PxpA [Chitinophagaceae bacterium]